MALNPIELLSLDKTRQSPFLRGPYVSLSRSFREGTAVETLVDEGLLHSLLRQRIPEALTHLYGHQEEAIRDIAAGRTTLVSTGTGSGNAERAVRRTGRLSADSLLMTSA